ncbi:asparagine-rich protein [Plasmodium falciparum RAJ116]|uniref:Asparagine-rich protein n=1 Tax=Plasmodium falciparum RAJ116 TaxID=580058 RepID=A0A0L0CVN8_PLAFA|nr:asparagine-rich protein [Plasmodium falciparum RAJ116]
MVCVLPAGRGRTGHVEHNNNNMDGTNNSNMNYSNNEGSNIAPNIYLNKNSGYENCYEINENSDKVTIGSYNNEDNKFNMNKMHVIKNEMDGNANDNKIENEDVNIPICGSSKSPLNIQNNNIEINHMRDNFLSNDIMNTIPYSPPTKKIKIEKRMMMKNIMHPNVIKNMDENNMDMDKMSANNIDMNKMSVNNIDMNKMCATNVDINKMSVNNIDINKMCGNNIDINKMSQYDWINMNQVQYSYDINNKNPK